MIYECNKYISRKILIKPLSSLGTLWNSKGVISSFSFSAGWRCLRNVFLCEVLDSAIEHYSVFILSPRRLCGASVPKEATLHP